MDEALFYAAIAYPAPSNENFYLHCHDEYEIFMFFEGDSKYVVEEKNYNLKPNDIIITRKHEMHRIWHNSYKKYGRLSIMVSPEFFKENNCTEYEKIFLKENQELGNKIDSSYVMSSGLYDAILRFKEFTKDFKERNTPIARCALTEILYHINIMPAFENPDAIEKPIKKIINYINDNYSHPISLDSLCEKFFISKYYLCRIFKKHTGLSVHQYIKEKRLLLFEELQKEGKSCTECAALSGFSDYSSFYRAYVNKYGKSPEKIKSKIQ